MIFFLSTSESRHNQTAFGIDGNADMNVLLHTIFVVRQSMLALTAERFSAWRRLSAQSRNVSLPPLFRFAQIVTKFFNSVISAVECVTCGTVFHEVPSDRVANECHSLLALDFAPLLKSAA
jgi:hypothetical protein